MEGRHPASSELVWIYLTAETALRGGNSVIKQVWESLLLQGEVDDVDLVESTPIVIKKDKAKVLTVSRALVLVTDRARLDGVVARFRNECQGTGLKLYALPVLAAVV